MVTSPASSGCGAVPSTHFRPSPDTTHIGPSACRPGHGVPHTLSEAARTATRSCRMEGVSTRQRVAPAVTSTSWSSAPARATPSSTSGSPTGRSRSSSRAPSAAPASTSGCIPTKMFVYPADLARSAAAAARPRRRHPVRRRPLARDPGPDLRPDRPDLPRRPRLAGERTPNVTLFEGHARFVDVRTLDTGTGETITADQFVIAAGVPAGRPRHRGPRRGRLPHQRHGHARSTSCPSGC